MKVIGTIRPLHDNVFISDMEFGEQFTAAGLIVKSDNGKTNGIHPRWGKVFAIGPDQEDVQVGDWICVEHGRWSRTVEWESESGETIEVRLVDKKAIMLISDEKPTDIFRTAT